EFRVFKMRVYQKVYAHAFRSLKDPSTYGRAVACGDGVTRVLHPGLFIESMDAEESTFFNGCMAASANVPCPSCLAHSSELDNITKSFPARTSAQMQQVYEEAQPMPPTKREEYLASRGLKDVEQFLWDFPNSDPYLARSYDLLHFDDLGKWGKHLWVLLKQIMKDTGYETRLTTTRQFIADYEKRCKAVTRKYGKQFNFLKQHMTAHVVDDIRQTGSLSNKTTRINEAYQQEARAQYETTNFKNAEQQMSQKDADMETIAFIRMAVNDHINTAQHPDGDTDDVADTVHSTQTWKLAAGTRNWTDAYSFSHDHQDNLLDGFNVNLRLALAKVFGQPLDQHTQVLVRLYNVKSYKCLHIYYQSQEDLRLGHDILHCSSSFHGQARHDCILYDVDGVLGFGRLRYLLQCRLSTGQRTDIVAVTLFHDSRWRPQTMWDDCEVFDEQSKLSFIPLSDVFRGAMMCPAYGSNRPQTYYLIDDVDGDMFLRLNGL
ncbi:hypothetical protein AURDEDRAFT_65386, partial [Auricularia subglabra TFB-10046 SS5]